MLDFVKLCFSKFNFLKFSFLIINFLRISFLKFHFQKERTRRHTRFSSPVTEQQISPHVIFLKNQTKSYSKFHIFWVATLLPMFFLEKCQDFGEFTFNIMTRRQSLQLRSFFKLTISINQRWKVLSHIDCLANSRRCAVSMPKLWISFWRSFCQTRIHLGENSRKNVPTCWITLGSCNVFRRYHVNIRFCTIDTYKADHFYGDLSNYWWKFCALKIRLRQRI